MARYTVTADYRATVNLDGTNTVVVLGKGSTVDLDADLAEFIERDSPGTLRKGGKASSGKKGQDRAHEPAANRAGG